MELASLQRTERRCDRVRHVRELLRIELLDHVYSEGTLPSEPQLMLRHTCSRNALREALNLLRQEGLIERVPGAGTFAVVDREVNRHDRLLGLSEQLEDGSRRVTVTVLDVRVHPAPTAVAERLGLKPGEEVVFFERRLCLDGSPLSVWSSYLPASVAAGLLECDLESEFYAVVEDQLGLRLGRAEISIDAMLADSSIAQLLDCLPGAPILHLTRMVQTDDGLPFEFGCVYLRGDRIQFTSIIGRPEAVEPG